jgi:peptidoglycan/LPS O-acetylase OafA/YrhL
MNDGNDKHMRRRGKYFNRQKEYIAGLDGLRAIAVLMVYHSRFVIPFYRNSDTPWRHREKY